MDLELEAEVCLELWKPIQVFLESWHVAALLAEHDLVVDEIQHAFRIGVQLGVLGEIVLDEDTIATLPALALVLPQQPGLFRIKHGHGPTRLSLPHL
jgi:hypothetical protein